MVKAPVYSLLRGKYRFKHFGRIETKFTTARRDITHEVHHVFGLLHVCRLISASTRSACASAAAANEEAGTKSGKQAHDDKGETNTKPISCHGCIPPLFEFLHSKLFVI